jgi:hypothetical protein
MTRLRSQLRSARQAYRSARYPGDLSAELLGKSGRAGAANPSRRWLLLTGLAGSAAAAAVMLSLLMSRAADLPRPWQTDPSQRALVDWLPVRPDNVPLPKFRPPTLPGVDRYPNLKPALPTLDLAALPDLPSRGLEWLRKAWHSIESA